MRIERGGLKIFHALALICCIEFPSQALAQPEIAAVPGSATSDRDQPGAAPVLLPLVTPDEAERLNVGRVDGGDQNRGIEAVASQLAAPEELALAAPVAPIPASTAELARALKYDPVLIYEFVRNNIEYLPIWGMLKGPEGALTDGQGTAFDIAQLTADLINADPSHSASATLVRGTVTLPAATAASWLRLNGMNVCPLANTFAAGGISTTYSVVAPPDCRGTPATITIDHVWVKVTIGSTTYEIDPSFKTHSKIDPVVDLPAVTGYNRSSFIATVCTSCNTNPNIVTTLNRSNILDPGNTQSYPKFARNLLSYLRANNIHDLREVIGGYKIDAIYATSLPTSLPYTVVSRIADPFIINGTWKAALLVNFNGISQLFSSDAIYGKRLTVTFNGSNFPQLNLDGTVVQTGTTAVSPGGYASVNLSICLPFSGINCSVATVDGSGKALWCSNSDLAPIRCVTANILSKGTYALTNSWGPTSHNMVQRHRVASIRAANAGIDPTAEPNLGEVLTTQGFSYSEQASLYQSLSQDGLRNGGYYYYIVGVSGHTGSDGGPYVDLPGVAIFSGLTTALDSNGLYSPAIRLDNFLDLVGQGSVLESTSVNQLSGISSVSTAKLLDIGISQTANNNVYDLRTCADYNTYNGALLSYSASVKSAIRSLVCDQAYRVVLPQRGDLSDTAITDPHKWTGAGYYGFPSSGVGAYPAIISGGYAGGYSGVQQPPASTVTSAGDWNEIIVTANVRNPAVTENSNGGDWLGWFKKTVRGIKRTVSDPVDQVTGAFLNDAGDISVGEAGTPRLLSFERSYTTGDISIASPMGQGWRNNLDISAQATSDGLRASGAYDAWDAAEMLVVKMVNRDLMSVTSLPVVNIAVAAIGNRWLGDRLVNNIVAVNGGTVATAFHRLADDSYNPGQYSTARLTGAPSAWVVKSADGTALSFNTADANGFARVATIIQPTGIVTTFNYSNPSQTVVSNNLGRRLNINWSGGRVSSVTDTPLLGAAPRNVSFTYSGHLLQQVTDTRGGRTLYCYDSVGRMTAYYLPTEGSGTNCAAAGAHIRNVYDSLGRVQRQTDGAGHITDLYLAGTRSEIVTHPGGGIADIRAINYLDNFGNVTRQINPRTGLATTYTFDAISRLERIDYPEGNAVETSYDIRSNPIRNCIIPKTAGAYPACNTSSGSSHIWTTTTYNEGTGIWNCAAINTCNQPKSVTDPLGYVTSFTYNSDGQIATVTSPTPTGYAGAPRTTYSYTATASLSGNINLLTQQTVTATAGSPPSIVTSFGYDMAANGLVLKTTTLDPSGLNLPTSYGYDGYGNQITVRGPRTDVNDTVTTTYDNARQPITIIYPTAGGGTPETRIAYNANGWVTATASKLGSQWMVSCTTYTASGQVLTRFGPYLRSSATDCSFAGNAAVPLVTYGYDGADRLISTTQADPAGDRVTRLALFPDNQVQTRTIAYGSPAAATEGFAYTDNGLLSGVTDARGDVTGLTYDGFDRVTQLRYPLAGGGGPSTSDVVAYAYDKRGAVVRRSIRGTSNVSGSCTQCIVTAYDQLGRVTQRSVPEMAANTSVVPNVAAVPGYTVYSKYDLIGRPASLGYSSSAPELSYTYDAASRLLSAVQYGRTLGYSYGNRAAGLARTMTWPGSAGTMLSCTDALGRVTQIKDAANCANTTGRLAGYSYDELSRLTAVARPSGANTSYTYEATGALDTLSHALGSAAVTYSFDYNRVLQITSRTTSNDLYAWTNHYNVQRGYSANGLDQYSAIMGDVPRWDGRGNLLAYRGSSWGYDGEDRLARAAQSRGTVTTLYDPAGRLRQASGSATTQFLYDGDQLVAEYNASGGALIARYVPGVASYDAAGVKSWYHADAQGSVIAQSSGAGAAMVINQYGPFGEPGLVASGRNQGRIRYTGQAMLTEAGEATSIDQILYDYRARIYAPKLGRFLQTDPIGTADGSNLYAYVGNDPINLSDPTGLAAEATTGWGKMVAHDLGRLAGGIAEGRFEWAFGGLPPTLGSGIGSTLGTASAAGRALAVENSFSTTGRISELRSAIPVNSSGRITMGVGLAEDSSGAQRILIGTSEPNGYLRPGVTLRPGETLAPGLGHAEVDIVTYSQQNNLRLLEIGATRPICPSCVPVVEGTGAQIVTPVKGQ